VFAHILVPLDLGPRNERVLVTARAVALQNRARVTLLHVVERIEHVPVAELRRFYARLEKEAQRRLARAARRFAEKKIPIDAAVMTGHPAQEIVRWAAVNDVDLIILGSHKVDPARPGRGWGTTSYKVGILCRCPVMLVK
jgi:nucleotide-binding universal stress UspA family protein